MKLIPITGEPTRYWVESSSLECHQCQRLFSRLKPGYNKMRNGTPCPVCVDVDVSKYAEPDEDRDAAKARWLGKIALKTRWHIVDIAPYWPIGQCACEHWNFNLKPEIEKLSPQQRADLSHREAAALRCSHLEAARTATLDVVIQAHEKERMKKSNGRTEEDQP